MIPVGGSWLGNAVLILGSKRNVFTYGSEPIPGYRLIERLGGGAAGVVWKCTAPGGLTIALKIIDLWKPVGSGQRPRFLHRSGLRELRCIKQMSEIKHPLLIEVHSVWLLDEQGNQLDYEKQLDAMLGAPAAKRGEGIACRFILIAQTLAKMTLEDRLRQHQKLGQLGIPIPELLGYMKDAAEAIDYLNSPIHVVEGRSNQPLQHCDIKPSNLLLRGNKAVVGDFGLVHVLHEQALAETGAGKKGTPLFISPECIHGRPTSASDQYSLAITYYELRTNDFPFAELTSEHVEHAHLHGTLDFAAVSPKEKEILKRATSLNFKDRYSTAMEMVNALTDAVGFIKEDVRFTPDSNKKNVPAGSSAETLDVGDVPPAPTPLPAPSPARGRLLLASVAGLSLFTVALGGGFYSWRLAHRSARTDESSISTQIIKAEDKASQTPPSLNDIIQAFDLASEDGFTNAEQALRNALKEQPNLADPAHAEYWRKELEAGDLGACLDSEGKRLAVRNAQTIWIYNTESLSSPPVEAVLEDKTAAIHWMALTSDSLITLDSSGRGEVRKTGAAHQTFKLSGVPFEAIVSPDGKWLATVARAEKQSKSVARLWSLQDTSGETKDLGEYSLNCRCVGWSSDSRRVLLSDSRGKSDLLSLTGETWNLTTGAKVFCMASAKGGVYFAGEFKESASENYKVESVDALGHRLESAPVDCKYPIKRLAVSAQGDLLAIGSDKGELAFHSIKSTRKPSFRSKLHGAAAIVAMVFDAEGKWLFTADSDGRVVGWDLEAEDGRVLIQANEELEGLFITKNNELICAGLERNRPRGIVRCWNVRRLSLIAKAAGDAWFSGKQETTSGNL